MNFDKELLQFCKNIAVALGIDSTVLPEMFHIVLAQMEHMVLLWCHKLHQEYVKHNLKSDIKVTTIYLRAL